MTPELLVSGNGLLKLGETAAKLKFKKGAGSNVRYPIYIIIFCIPIPYSNNI
jgi:hypothetical protein